MSDRPKSLVLLILDGCGHSPEKECNAIAEQTEYRKASHGSAVYLSAHIKNGLDEVWSNFNMKQFSLGETKKYVHVTSTLNGGKMRLAANHGNIHPMQDEETEQSYAARMMNQVSPKSICCDDPRATGLGLSSLAPTMLDILGVSQLVEMMGRLLLAPN